MQDFVNLPFRFGMTPPSNKPARFTKNTVIAINHIITNSILECDFKTGIIKTDLSDHYPIVFPFKSKENNKTQVKYIYKLVINENLIEVFMKSFLAYMKCLGTILEV